MCSEKPKQEVLEHLKRDHPRKEDEKPSEAELEVMNCPGEFFFATETCVPTAAPAAAVMNRLWGEQEWMMIRASSKDIGVHQILFSKDSRFIVWDDYGNER